MNRRGDENPFGVIDADERKLQQPPKTFLGAQIGMIAPGDVGQRADRDAQPRLRRRLAWKKIGCPWNQRGREIGHARERQADELRAFDERIEIALGLVEL